MVGAKSQRWMFERVQVQRATGRHAAIIRAIPGIVTSQRATRLRVHVRLATAQHVRVQHAKAGPASLPTVGYGTSVTPLIVQSPPSIST